MIPLNSQKTKLFFTLSKFVVRSQMQSEPNTKKKITLKEVIKVNIPCQSLTRMTFDEKSNRILICDSKDAKIKVLNADNYELILDVNPGERLIHPVSLCANNLNGHVFIGDYKTESILVFSENFEFIKEIGEKIQPYYIQCDSEENILYVSDKKTCKISLYDIQSGQLLKYLSNVEKPGYFKIVNELMYVIDGNKDTLECFVLGQKKYLLQVINKSTGELVDSFDLNRYLALRGIFVVNDYVFITANRHEYEKTKTAYRVREGVSGRNLISINTQSTIKTHQNVSNKRVDDSFVYYGTRPHITESNFIDYSIDGNYLIPDKASDLLFIGSKLLVCQSNQQTMAFQVFDLQF